MQSKAKLLKANSFIENLNLQIMKLKTTFQTLILVLIYSLIIESSSQQLQQKHRFPRFIWVFWQGELNTFTSLCFNNMKHFANQSGWQFTVLNMQIFQSFLGEQTRQLFHKIQTKGQYKTSKLADLIRLFIIYQRGGIWLDASSLLIDNLDWLDDVQNQEFFYNKIAKQPETIFFTYNHYYGGNKTVLYDQDLQKEVYVLPGLENWIIISKARSKFLTDNIELIRKNSLERKESQQEIVKSFIKQGYSYYIQADPYFLFGNFNLQTTLQMKQKQIQKNPAAFNTKYAVDYYQIWLMRAQVTAFKHLHFFRTSTFQKMIFYQYDKEQTKTTKMIKFIGNERHELNVFMQAFPYLICLGLVDKLPKESFFYQYALSFELYNPSIQSFKRLYEQPQAVCSGLWNSIRLYVIGVLGFILAIGYLFHYLVRKFFQKPKGYQGFKAIQTNYQ